MNVAVLRNELSARVYHLSYDQLLLVRELMDSFGDTESQPSDPFFSETNQQHLLKAVRELRAGKGTPHELIEIDDE